MMNTISSFSGVPLDSPWRHATSRNVAIATGAVGSVYFLWRWYRNRDLPPGPPSWPVIGCWGGFSEEHFEEEMLRLKEKYGDVFSLWQGTSFLVVLASSSVIREALVTNREVFASRTERFTQILNEYLGTKDDVFASSYDPLDWVQNKAFIVNSLRSAGFNKADRILDQIERLQTFLLSSQSQPIDLEDAIRKTAANCICSILFSESWEYEDPELDRVVELIIDWSIAIFGALSLEHIPMWLAKPIYRNKIKYYRACAENVQTWIQEKVLQHKATLDPDNPRDLIDIFLIQKGTEHELSRIVDNVGVCLQDPIDNLPNLIYAVILYITYHQDHQLRAHEEILRLTDGNRSVTWADHGNLPYNEAIIMEVQRLVPLFDLLPGHTASKDVYVKGYRIPKGSPVHMFFYAAFRDSKAFPEPYAFKPERFIGPNGELVKSDALISFSLGRRRCMGEAFAKMVSFLVITNMLQHFHIKFPEGETGSLVPTGLPGFRRPQNFRVILTPRH